MTEQQKHIGDIVELRSGKEQPQYQLLARITRIYNEYMFDGFIYQAGSEMESTHPIGEIVTGMSLILFDVVMSDYRHNKAEQNFMDALRKLRYNLEQKHLREWKKKNSR